ncbi:hypothetical protein HK405_014136, partial [Cladochytrium tenue]
MSVLLGIYSAFDDRTKAAGRMRLGADGPGVRNPFIGVESKYIAPGRPASGVLSFDVQGAALGDVIEIVAELQAVK